ncbi:thiol reductant ABC exporter subunit CydD [Salinispirillum sp. LH 10-3-1]|uniref:Thiol reductant ABC exporter subunit CydD n=1 Tax=Salinispirillum sp. LH 10-3-1 TaxID=2952525 RepID=A0AB38YEU9_9GAMM
MPEPTAKQWLRSIIKPARNAVRLAAVAGSVAGLATVGLLWALAVSVSGLLVEGLLLAELMTPLAGLLLCIIVRALAQYAQEVFGAQASIQVRSLVRERLLTQWADNGPLRNAELSPAERASQYVQQVEALDGYVARYLPQQTITVAVPAIILAIVFYLDWVAALLLLFSAPLIPLFMALVGMGAEKINQQHFASLSRLSGHFLDRLHGITTLQIFGQTRQAEDTVAQASNNLRRLTMKTLRVAFLSSTVLEFFASVAIAMLAIYIGFGLLGYIDWGPSTDLTLFSGLLILLLAPEFFQPLRTLAQHYHDRAAALGAAETLSQVQAQTAASKPATDTVATAINSTPDSTIVFDHVTLTFPERGTLFHRFNAQFQRGEIIGLSGPTGSGKSSILNLMAGFIQPTSGSVRVNGQPAGQAPIAWMSQKPFLLFGSWADNLRWMAPLASEQDMHDAVAQVGLTDLLHRLPQGLNSPVGEDGRFLSGGEAQRLALARIWLSDAQWVLLDEPTAALDAESTALIADCLDRLAAQGRGVILSSHDADLLQRVHRIIRINDKAALV